MVDSHTESRAVAMEVVHALLYGALPYALLFLWPNPIFGRVFTGLSRLCTTNPSTFKAFFTALNLVQVLLCSWIIYLVVDMGFFDEFGFFYIISAHLRQEEPNSAIIIGTPKLTWLSVMISLQALNACCYYHLSNTLALIDTVYMKMHRKEVTFLHVYHHSSALVWSWIVSKLVPGGRSLFSVVGICVAHTAIYLYYFTLLVGIKLNRHFCWTLLTLLQMVLIALGIIYMSMVFFYDSDYPKSVAAIYVFFSIILFLLFVDLFVKRQSAATKGNHSFRKYT